MEKEKYIEHLFWFYQFKRDYRRYFVLHKNLIEKYKGRTVDFFTEIRRHSDHIFTMGDYVYKELDNNVIEVKSHEGLKTILKEIQCYLDALFDEMDNEYANAPEEIKWDFPFHPIISELQRKVRNIYVEKFGVAEQLKKQFEDYFLLNNRIEFANQLRIEFKTEIGKEIRILIEILKTWEPVPILTLGTRDLKGFIESMQSFFKRDIGYESVRKTNPNDAVYEDDWNNIKNRVRNIITKTNNEVK